MRLEVGGHLAGSRGHGHVSLRANEAANNERRASENIDIKLNGSDDAFHDRRKADTAIIVPLLTNASQLVKTGMPMNIMVGAALRI